VWRRVKDVERSCDIPGGILLASAMQCTDLAFLLPYDSMS